jgi:hypothetical protein
LSQIWLNYFLNDCHIDYITKSLKQTLLWEQLLEKNITESCCYDHSSVMEIRCP